MSAEDKVRRITGGQVPREWARDVELLRRLVDRSEKIIESTSRFLGHESAPREYRIATVSSDLRFEDLSPISKSAERGYKTYAIRSNTVLKRLRRDFLSDLGQAVDAGADIVCFNEMAFPCGRDATKSKDFEDEVRRVVEDRQILLLAGTFHHPETDHNLCPIFSPGREVEYHAKLTTAVRIHEEVRTPAGRKMRYYHTTFGKASILICLDVFEPTLFLRLLRQSNHFSSAEDIDLVFVPSFSPHNSQILCDACEDLSYVTGAVVVYVNCAERSPRHAVFVAGKRMPAKSSPSDGYQRRAFSSRGVLHTVRTGTLRALRNTMRDSYSPLLQYMMADEVPEAPVFYSVRLE
ncbi:MAG: hypothetical protein WAM82_03455 [Thermoanaerobaculia bacterium]